MKTRTKYWAAAVVGSIAIVALLAAVKVGQIGAMIRAGKTFVPPPEAVTTASVEAADWQEARDAVGTLVAVRAVTVAAELTGTVREIGFDSGELVRKDALLAKLDTSVEEAQLAAAAADAALARSTLERAITLFRGGANTQADLDAAQARAKQTAAAVAQLQATIAKKTIRAPFEGRVSIRQVELGQVVSPGTPIATLQSVSPIYADFWLPQQALAEIAAGQRTRVETDTFPREHWDGAITVINPEIDPSTRNVRVRATLGNPGGRLRPGMFVKVQVLSSESHPVVIIPATSVIYAPYGDSVFVVDQKKGAGGKAELVARQQFVRLGERRGDFVAVVSGLTTGDTIVSNGAFKLRNGSAVVVNNALAPRAELAPSPAEQ